MDFLQGSCQQGRCQSTRASIRPIPPESTVARHSMSTAFQSLMTDDRSPARRKWYKTRERRNEVGKTSVKQLPEQPTAQPRQKKQSSVKSVNRRKQTDISPSPAVYPSTAPSWGSGRHGPPPVRTGPRDGDRARRPRAPRRDAARPCCPLPWTDGHGSSQSPPAHAG